MLADGQGKAVAGVGDQLYNGPQTAKLSFQEGYVSMFVARHVLRHCAGVKPTFCLKTR
jgi:hypothetical protein